MFRRRKDAGSTDPSAESVASDQQVGAGTVGDGVTTGPFDSADTPKDGLLRIDLGCLLVPGTEGMELRLEVEQATNTVVAATIVQGDSALQLMAFAAPRRDGIWDDVRTEIRDNLSLDGDVEEIDGVFGRELLASIPQSGDEGAETGPVRFIGVNGPRWFLRGLISGPASRDAELARPLEDVIRATTVVRGDDPYAPGDPLPLRFPTEIPDDATDFDDGAEQDADDDEETRERPTLSLPERGPEITEIR